MATYEGRYRETVRGFGGEEAHGEQRGQSLAETIQSLDIDLVTLRGCIQSIGTQFDDPSNRAELKRLRGVIGEKLANGDKELKELRRNNPQQKMIVDRQAKQLRDITTKYEDLLEAEKKATKQNPLGSGMTSPSYENSSQGGDGGSLIQVQTGMSNLEAREREAAELQDLERDIFDLHAIQTDITGMVMEQGDDIDRIEVQTEKAQGRVEHGLKQTEETVALKKKNIKLKLIIGGVVAGVIITLVIVTVIVLATVIPNNS